MNSFRNNLSWQGKRIFSGVKELPNLRLSVLRKVFSLMGRRERNILLALIAVAVISFIISSFNLLGTYTSPQPARGGEYSEGIIGQPRYINPLLATSNTDKALVNLVYAGLYKHDAEGNVVPQLATDFPELSEDEQSYTVRIKDGAQWHNGLPVTAEDVVFTIETLQNADYASPRRNDWLSTTVEAIDEQTVKFTLEGPSSTFLNNLTLPIISRSIWSQVGPADFILSQSNIEAIGNGPYRIKEVKKLAQGKIQTITLESFSDFADQVPYIDTVKLYFFDSSEELLKAVHGKKISGFGFSQFDEKISIKDSARDLTVHQIPLPQYQAAFFNTTNRALGDPVVRRAMDLATNSESILNDVYDGQGILIDSPILRQHVANLPETTSAYNPDEAAGLLDQADYTAEGDDWVRFKGNRRLEFKMATNDNPVNVRTAEMLVEQWQKIGVKINLSILPTKELNDNVIKPRDYDILLFAQKLGADPDPFIFWHSSQTKHPGLNLSNYDNENIDTLITQARAANSKPDRDAIYLQIHEYFKLDIPAIFLVQTVYTYAIDQEIKGFGITSLPDETYRFHDLPNWYLDTKRVLK